MLKKGQEEDIEKLPEQWKDLVREVLEKKIKMSIPAIVGIWRMPAGRKVPGIETNVIWLENCENIKVGVKHVIDQYVRIETTFIAAQMNAQHIICAEGIPI
jgi:hypothetical protein